MAQSLHAPAQPRNVHAAEVEVAGGVAPGVKLGVATKEPRKQAAKRKRQRGAQDAQNSQPRSHNADAIQSFKVDNQLFFVVRHVAFVMALKICVFNHVPCG